MLLISQFFLKVIIVHLSWHKCAMTTLRVCGAVVVGSRSSVERLQTKGNVKSDIDRLASIQFTSAAANQNHAATAAVKPIGRDDDGGRGHTSCVVCMCEFVNRQRIREFPCQHIFHLKCIDKWLKVHTRTHTHKHTCYFCVCKSYR